MRTVMAADRTLMAWVRTALSMLSFGFTIYKFLDGVETSQHLAPSHAPQNIGLFLAGAGTLSMIMGTFEYFSTLQDLNRLERFRLDRPVFLMAILFSLSGTALFIAIAFKLL
jgi:putative membrane protein